MEEPTNRQDSGRNADGTFKPGFSGNPEGRPKDTLKAFIAREFRAMSDDEKRLWLQNNKVSPDLIWRMAEGNPAQATDITSDGKPLILPSEIINKNGPDSFAQGTKGDSE